MADQSYTDLKARATLIKNETINNANSATRVGSLEFDIVDSFQARIVETTNLINQVEADLLDGVASDGETLAKLRALITTLAGQTSTIGNQVNTINNLLLSDDIDLDSIQEIVNFIKDNQTEIDSLLSGKLDKTAKASEAEANAQTDDSKYITSLRLGTWLASLLARALTWTGNWTFTGVLKMDSLTASKWLKLNASKEIVASDIAISDVTNLSTSLDAKADKTTVFFIKGDTDCSASPNYPAAVKGDRYRVSVAGKIGGASGKSVVIDQEYYAKADNAGGNEAAVGTSWAVTGGGGGTVSNATTSTAGIVQLDIDANIQSNTNSGRVVTSGNLNAFMTWWKTQVHSFTNTITINLLQLVASTSSKALANLPDGLPKTTGLSNGDFWRVGVNLLFRSASYTAKFMWQDQANDTFAGAATAGIQVDTVGTPSRIAFTNIVTGQATLVAGTIAMTITGLTTSSLCVGIVVVSRGGTTANKYVGVCSANTLTITAYNGDTAITTDTSTLNYWVQV